MVKFSDLDNSALAWCRSFPMLELWLDIVIKIYWIVMPVLVSLLQALEDGCCLISHAEPPILPSSTSSSHSTSVSQRRLAMFPQVVVVVARLFSGNESKDSDTATESKLSATHNGYSR